MPAYLWKGDLFCDGDIVPALTDDSPWHNWITDGGEPSDDTEDDLDDIADMFDIDRQDPVEVAEAGFPVLVRNPTDGLCVVCLRFFRNEVSVDRQEGTQ